MKDSKCTKLNIKRTNLGFKHYSLLRGFIEQSENKKY